MTTRIAIVGLGKMGIMHAAVVGTHPRAEIAAIVDVQPRLEPYARGLGLKAPFYASVDEMLATAEVDAVMVCTPASTHLPIAAACVERGLHVFVEKPLADSLDSARKMYALVKNTRLIHAVGYMKAHYPLHQKMHALVRGGTLGRVRQCHCAVYLSQVFRPPKGWIYDRACSGGGVVINSASHLLFLLWWLFGDVRGVFARAQSVHSSVEDVATVVLEFDSGVVASMDASWSVQGYPVEHSEMRIVGERGTLEITDDGARLYLTQDSGQYRQGWTAFHRSELDRAPVDLSADYGGEGYCNEDFHFVECCATGCAPLVSWREGLAVQEIVDAIYRSAGEGYVAL